MPTAFAAVLTTIRPPTESVRRLSERLAPVGGRLVVAGDLKGPVSYDPPGAVFLDLPAQVRGPFRLARALPTGHYSRKNIAYLEALRLGAACLYETDDDTSPLPGWRVRPETVTGARRVSGPGWVNAYRYFTDDPDLWPRGFPLERLNDPAPGVEEPPVAVPAPVQQGLVNGSPDIDAVWRLTQDRAFDFDDRPPLALGPGQWCPFNTQSTWWRPPAFPLLYIPSFCSFRMCDIWRSFVAQRCLWAMGAGVVFHAAEARQDRNPHDLRRDFEEEIPGYLHNARIAAVLSGLSLAPGEDAVADNLLACYGALADARLLPGEERPLVETWLADLRGLERGGAS